MPVDLRAEDINPEKALKETLDKYDINKWENLRGPRPWENPIMHPQAGRSGGPINVVVIDKKDGRILSEEESQEARRQARDDFERKMNRRQLGTVDRYTKELPSPTTKVGPSTKTESNQTYSVPTSSAHADKKMTADEVSTMFSTTSRSDEEQKAYDEDLVARAIAGREKDKLLKT